MHPVFFLLWLEGFYWSRSGLGMGPLGGVWRVRSVFGIKNNVIAVEGDVVSLGVIK